MKRKEVTDYVVGQQIRYKPSGKVARLDGISGKIIEGTVLSMRDDGDLIVKAAVKCLPKDSLTAKMSGSLISTKQVIA